jgi:nucleotide-binding universal stress UspA family protein
MGSHGWRGLDRLLLGSEAQRVILESDVPVLVDR